MAPALARPHTHLSNRAKIRAALDRKPVFKSVLQNPFQIGWPSIPPNVQNVLLARLVTALENVPSRTHTPRKIPLKTAFSGRQGNEPISDGIGCVSQAPDQAPVVSSHVVGINAVTRALESQLLASRKTVAIRDPSQSRVHPSPPPALSPIHVVFVCCADLDPPALVAHIPHLVAGCNSPRNATHPIKLIPLPKGSEPAIAQSLGVRRAAVIAFYHGSLLSEAVQDILDSVPILCASWLSPSDPQSTSVLVPAHIKQLPTTAPKDMKCAREQRSRARVAAKKRASGSSRSLHRKSRLTLTTRSEGAT